MTHTLPALVHFLPMRASAQSPFLNAIARTLLLMFGSPDLAPIRDSKP
jgi:hypothetical protein